MIKYQTIWFVRSTFALWRVWLAFVQSNFRQFVRGHKGALIKCVNSKLVLILCSMINAWIVVMRTCLPLCLDWMVATAVSLGLANSNAATWPNCTTEGSWIRHNLRTCSYPGWKVVVNYALWVALQVTVNFCILHVLSFDSCEHSS